MVLFRLGPFAMLSAMALAFLGMASPAQAQVPCTGAPGEQMVAVKTEPGGATVPLCIPGAAPRASTTAVSRGTHAAFAYHEDASDIWVDGRYTGPRHSGERISLERCNHVMGGGCRSGGGWGNSTMVVFRSARGVLFWAWSYDEESIATAQKACRSDAFLPCEQVFKYGSGTRQRFPGSEARKRYLAAAWVKGTEEYNGKLYISSGEPTYAEAADKAINACQIATDGRECAVIEFSADGVLQAYRSNDEHGVLTETTAGRAMKAVQGKCAKARVKCTLQAQFDARRTGQFVHDFTQGGKAGPG